MNKKYFKLWGKNVEKWYSNLETDNEDIINLLPISDKPKYYWKLLFFEKQYILECDLRGEYKYYSYEEWKEHWRWMFGNEAINIKFIVMANPQFYDRIIWDGCNIEFNDNKLISFYSNNLCFYSYYAITSKDKFEYKTEEWKYLKSILYDNNFRWGIGGFGKSLFDSIKWHDKRVEQILRLNRGYFNLHGFNLEEWKLSGVHYKNNNINIGQKCKYIDKNRDYTHQLMKEVPLIKVDIQPWFDLKYFSWCKLTINKSTNIKICQWTEFIKICGYEIESGTEIILSNNSVRRFLETYGLELYNVDIDVLESYVKGKPFKWFNELINHKEKQYKLMPSIFNGICGNKQFKIKEKQVWENGELKLIQTEVERKFNYYHIYQNTVANANQDIFNKCKEIGWDNIYLIRTDAIIYNDNIVITNEKNIWKEEYKYYLNKNFHSQKSIIKLLQERGNIYED